MKEKISALVFLSRSQSLGMLSQSDNSGFHSTCDKVSHHARFLTPGGIAYHISRLVYLSMIAFFYNTVASRSPLGLIETSAERETRRRDARHGIRSSSFRKTTYFCTHVHGMCAYIEGLDVVFQLPTAKERGIHWRAYHVSSVRVTTRNTHRVRAVCMRNVRSARISALLRAYVPVWLRA